MNQCAYGVWRIHDIWNSDWFLVKRAFIMKLCMLFMEVAPFISAQIPTVFRPMFDVMLLNVCIVSCWCIFSLQADRRLLLSRSSLYAWRIWRPRSSVEWHGSWVLWVWICQPGVRGLPPSLYVGYMFVSFMRLVCSLPSWQRSVK